MLKLLKSIAKKNDKLYALFFVVYSFFLCFKTINLVRRNKQKFFSVKKYKKKQTIVLLGSGPSALDFNFSSFKKEMTSTIGWNFWIYHDFVPDFYVFEIKASNIYTWKLFCEILTIKQKEYRKTIFILKDLEYLDKDHDYVFHFIPSSLRKNFYSSIDFNLGRGSDRRFLLTLSIYEYFPLLWKFFAKSRASVSLCLAIASRLATQNIVIAGVDLDDSSFHLARDFKSKKFPNLPIMKRTPELIKNTLGNGQPHSSDSPEHHPRISFVIKAFVDIFKKRNITTYCISNNSALTDFLEIWDGKTQ